MLGDRFTLFFLVGLLRLFFLRLFIDIDSVVPFSSLLLLQGFFILKGKRYHERVLASLDDFFVLLLLVFVKDLGVFLILLVAECLLKVFHLGVQYTLSFLLERRVSNDAFFMVCFLHVLAGVHQLH